MTSKLEISRRKQILFIIIQIGLLLSIEARARIVPYLLDDLNPYYLTYGFVLDIEWHSAEFDGYTKFQPRSQKHQKYHDSIDWLFEPSRVTV